MSDMLELLPGSIEVEKNVAEIHVWTMLKNYLSEDIGFLGYRVLPLGNKNIKDTPSFTIISKKYGLIFIDVCSDKLINIDEEEFWCFHSTGSLYSRDALIEFFAQKLGSGLVFCLKGNNEKIGSGLSMPHTLC